VLEYNNSGWFLSSSPDTILQAPLTFPADEVRIRRVILRAHDTNSGENPCVALRRANPGVGADDQMAIVCTDGAVDAVQSVGTTAVSPRRVGAWQAVYLQVSLSSDTRLYGVTVEWAPNDP
jgi:hypothetical protein